MPLCAGTPGVTLPQEALPPRQAAAVTAGWRGAASEWAARGLFPERGAGRSRTAWLRAQGPGRYELSPPVCAQRSDSGRRGVPGVRMAPSWTRTLFSDPHLCRPRQSPSPGAADFQVDRSHVPQSRRSPRESRVLRGLLMPLGQLGRRLSEQHSTPGSFVAVT